MCCDRLPPGGAELDIAVLFADLRGSTVIGEHLTPGAYAEMLNQFYNAATEVLVRHDAIIDKLVGDEVMGLFLTAFPSLEGTACRAMVRSAREILQRVQVSDPVLPVGIGLNFGVARVGNVGGGSVKDFTAVGDVVNTAARLQSHAQSGEIVMSDAVYEQVKDHHPHVAPLTLSLKGKSKGVCAYRLDESGQAIATIRQQAEATRTP